MRVHAHTWATEKRPTSKESQGIVIYRAQLRERETCLVEGEHVLLVRRAESKKLPAAAS
jgi:hypothetical protein